MGEALVWYAAYGSNVDRQRFLVYVTGGPVPGTSHVQDGARDPTPPRQDRAHRFNRSIRFALHSRRWSGAIAVLDHEISTAGAFGRRYLITTGQLADVVAQENRRPTAELPLTELVIGEIRGLSDGTHDGLLLIGDDDGVPIVTFTCPSDPAALSTAPPSATYLATIARGIRDAHDLTTRDVARLLHAVPGVAPAWTIEGIESLIQ